MIRTKVAPSHRGTRHRSRRSARGTRIAASTAAIASGMATSATRAIDEEREREDAGDPERQPGPDAEGPEPARSLETGDPPLGCRCDTSWGGSILGTARHVSSSRSDVRNPSLTCRMFFSSAQRPGEAGVFSGPWTWGVRCRGRLYDVPASRSVDRRNGPTMRGPERRVSSRCASRLSGLGEVLAEDHPGRERQRGRERGGQLEHTVLALGQQCQPSVDVQSREEGHDRGDHHDERRNPEPTGDEVADGADGDGGGRGAPGPADLGAVDGRAGPPVRAPRPGPRPRGRRNGAYDANANPAAARAAPNTVTPASARPAAPGLKSSSPTPEQVPDGEARRRPPR